MRKHYLDNLRTIMILLLFPVHTFMIWNNYGLKFYIWNGENNLLSTLIIIVNPWFMALLFLIAGISTKHSLEHRNLKEFIKERFTKLMIPFISGLLLLVPVQTLYARKFFFNYDGTLIENYKYFFTHFKDLSGYDGSFTPAHLWFILYLFVISLISIPIIKNIPYDKISKKLEKLNIIKIILLFILIWLMYYIGNFGGYSIGKYFTLYLLGYYIFSNETIINKLLENKKLIISLFIFFELLLLILYYNYSYYGDLLVNIVSWLGVLSSLIIGKIFLNKETKLTKYFKNHSFTIYILHQTILVVLAYYTLILINNIYLEIIIILIGSFIITILSSEILKRIPYLRVMFGIHTK